MIEGRTEERLLAVTRRFVDARGGDPGEVAIDDAVCQDLLIFGVDVEDYVQALEGEFGPVVSSIPWFTYTDQTGSFRGCKACIVAPIYVPWMLFKVFVLRQRSVAPDPRAYPHRLTLRQVAQAIDAGGWPQDYWP